MQAQGIVSTILPAHVVAGVLALVFGYVALVAAKGATLHRRSGILFVYAMVTMSLSATVMAFLTASQVNVVAGLLTFYFVVTALFTVRPRFQASHRIDVAAMLFALTVAILAFMTSFEVAASGQPEAGPMFIFGAMGLLAAIGDMRMIRARGIQGRRRIARHLWRMCFAMWVAAGSFFWGPPRRVPEVIRIPALQTLAVLLPVAVMLYWLWRIRARKTPRGMAGLAVPQTNAG